MVDDNSSSTPNVENDTSDSETLHAAPFFLARIYQNANDFDKVIRDDSDSSVDGFEELVVKDLDVSEKAELQRSALINVAGTAWTDTDFTAEPESYKDNDEAEESTVDPSFHRVATLDTDKWKLEPDELIRLIQSEFGSIGEGEKLVFEADGLILNDVIIVGVLHLTTHRLTFHASLLSVRPDLSPSQQVIKAGPVTIHIPNSHKKKRLWLELTHDMLCSYTSSDPDDRIRPVRSILLSSIQGIYQVPNNPRMFRLHCQVSDPLRVSGLAEFDTEESAQEWRKELTGAIFLQRHRRHEAIGGDFSDASSGVRFSYPLHKITNVRMTNAWRKHWAIIQVDGLEQNDGILYLAPVLEFPEWLNLETYINEAKRRAAAATTPPDTPVIVDLGPLTFDQNPRHPATQVPADSKEHTLRQVLGLGQETDLWFVRARLYRAISCAGYFVVSPHYVGFWGKVVMRDDEKYRLPLKIVKSTYPISGKIFKAHGICLEIEGAADVKFQFKTKEIRDEAILRINNARAMLSAASVVASPSSTCTTFSSSVSHSDTLSSTSSSSPSTPGASAIEAISPQERVKNLIAVSGLHLPMSTIISFPKVINLEANFLINHPSLHFVCLTIGSRGDVQPYIALGTALKKENHQVTIVTHEEYREWIEGFGLNFKQAGGDPGALMKLSVEHKMFSPEFFKESLANFRGWLDQLLVDAWDSCQGADILLESPSAMAGVHIAEKLQIPYFRTFTMPWTKTSEFPHAFLSPPVDSPTFNSASYVLFNNVMWAATSGQINRWRRHTLHLENTDMSHMAQSKIMFIYNFSQAVVPKPLDWGDSIAISGYWFLDNPDLSWEPPESLLDFMKKARADSKPIVYIGFGSITVPNPNRVTSRIVEAVLKSGVRAIVSKGWSARMSKPEDNLKDPEPIIPPEIYQLDKVPHDWLFPQIDAALHHGGAGTTGASLRAGIPTLIKPWFGDQFFWASRVQKLGAGLKVSSLSVNELAEALTKATTSRIMKEKAALVGERIRSENGVRTAIRTIYTYIDRASKDRTLLR